MASEPVLSAALQKAIREKAQQMCALVVIPGHSVCGVCRCDQFIVALTDLVLQARAKGSAHRCSGCDLRWTGELKGAELCGDCWRKAQPVVHGAKGSAPQWQPIDTAPNDEQRVILFNPDEHIDWAIVIGAYYEQLGGWHYDGQSPGRLNAPTHWMTLPAPPSQEPRS